MSELKQRAFVSGIAGFIGSHVSDALLASGYEVMGIDDLSTGFRDNVPPGCKLVVGDIRDGQLVLDLLREFRPRFVLHQAAQISVSRSVREPALDAWVNVVGTINLLSAAAEVGVERFVFASSGGAIYGDVYEPASESHSLAPSSPYGLSKLCAEKYVRYFGEERGLEYVILRYGNVYGPRQDPRGEAGVVAIFTEALLEGRAPVINGDGEYVRDYVYVEDVAEANLLALRPGAAGGTFNVGTGVGTTVNQLYRALCSALGLEISPRYGPPRPGDLRSSILDPGSAGRALGWRPRHSLSHGLRKTVEWYRASSKVSKLRLEKRP